MHVWFIYSVLLFHGSGSCQSTTSIHPNKGTSIAGASQILTEGREVVWILYWHGGGGPKICEWPPKTTTPISKRPLVLKHALSPVWQNMGIPYPVLAVWSCWGLTWHSQMGFALSEVVGFRVVYLCTHGRKQEGTLLNFTHLSGSCGICFQSYKWYGMDP